MCAMAWRGRLSWLLLGILVCGDCRRPARARTSVRPLLLENEVGVFGAAIRAAILEHLPREFEEECDWGATVQTRALGFEGFAPRWFEQPAYDGVWARVRVSFPELEQGLRVRTESVHCMPDGRLRGRARVTAPAVAIARFAGWSRGISLYDVKTEATGVVEATLEFTVTMESSSTGDEIRIRPVVHRSWLALREFSLDRAGPLAGRWSRCVGGLLESTVQDRLYALEADLADAVNHVLTEEIGEFPNQAPARALADDAPLAGAIAEVAAAGPSRDANSLASPTSPPTLVMDGRYASAR